MESQSLSTVTVSVRFLNIAENWIHESTTLLYI